MGAPFPAAQSYRALQWEPIFYEGACLVRPLDSALSVLRDITECPTLDVADAYAMSSFSADGETILVGGLPPIRVLGHGAGGSTFSSASEIVRMHDNTP